MNSEKLLKLKTKGAKKLKNWGGGTYACSDCKNNRFEKKFIVQNTNVYINSIWFPKSHLINIKFTAQLLKLIVIGTACLLC